MYFFSFSVRCFLLLVQVNHHVNYHIPPLKHHLKFIFIQFNHLYFNCHIQLIILGLENHPQQQVLCCDLPLQSPLYFHFQLLLLLLLIFWSNILQKLFLLIIVPIMNIFPVSLPVFQDEDIFLQLNLILLILHYYPSHTFPCCGSKTVICFHISYVDITFPGHSSS